MRINEIAAQMTRGESCCCKTEAAVAPGIGWRIAVIGGAMHTSVCQPVTVFDAVTPGAMRA